MVVDQVNKYYLILFFQGQVEYIFYLFSARLSTALYFEWEFNLHENTEND